MIKAEIIADSLNSAGNRLTTFILEYPRFVHAEFMTHRVLSKNAASSRAIPIEKMIQQVRDNPALPVWWGKNQSGMQANEELDNVNAIYSDELPTASSDSVAVSYTTREYAEVLWLHARDKAIASVELLNSIGLHKQIANRILEPWFHIRVICSGTEWENFFALRVHKDAQPEIRALAEKMLYEYNNSSPKSLVAGSWHIPFGDQIDETKLQAELGHMLSDTGLNYSKEDLRKKIAVARCARISYLNYEGKDDYGADIKLCDRLFSNTPRHLSPTEHIAQALEDSTPSGNFKGFKQYRKFFLDENLKDDRVTKKHWSLS